MINIDLSLRWPRIAKFRRINCLAWTGRHRAVEINHYRDNSLLRVEIEVRFVGDHAPQFRLLVGALTHEFEFAWYDQRHP